MKRRIVPRLISLLRLRRHPEGGWFRETYRSRDGVERPALPRGFKGRRAFSTAIYFLLESGDFSAFHRVRSDELWHFHAGGPLDLFVIEKNGRLTRRRLGLNVEKGQRPQIAVPAGRWFAARPVRQRSYTRVSCTVSPGFDFKDFELGRREELVRFYPRLKAVVRTLTRDKRAR